MEAAEEVANGRHVVQREHEFPTDAAESLLELAEIRFAEIDPVQVPPPVRRVEIKQRGGPIEAREDGFIRKRFDLHAGEPAVRVLNELSEVSGIETPRRLD